MLVSVNRHSLDATVHLYDRSGSQDHPCRHGRLLRVCRRTSGTTRRFRGKSVAIRTRQFLSPKSEDVPLSENDSDLFSFRRRLLRNLLQPGSARDKQFPRSGATPTSSTSPWLHGSRFRPAPRSISRRRRIYTLLAGSGDDSQGLSELRRPAAQYTAVPQASPKFVGIFRTAITGRNLKSVRNMWRYKNRT